MHEGFQEHSTVGTARLARHHAYSNVGHLCSRQRLPVSSLYVPAKLYPRDMQYNVEPGAKRVTELLQKIPTWLTLSDAEKCEMGITQELNRTRWHSIAHKHEL